jgi:hypothetical protein
MKKGLISGITKIGMVVSNLDEVIENYKKIGHQPAAVFEMSVAAKNLRNVMVYNIPVKTGVKSAVYKFDSVLLEIIMPIDKNNIFWKFLEKTGGGIHHIGIQSNDYSYDESKAILNETDSDQVMYGEASSGTAFSYIDASQKLGTIVEIFNYDLPKF